jgi:glutaminase
MNLPVPKATAKLIIAITEPHVEKYLAAGDVTAAYALQSIISSINLALKTDSPIQFT